MIDRQQAIESCYLIPGWCWPVELGAIYDLVAGRQRHVELGSFCGRSLFVAGCALATGGTLVSVDPQTYGGIVLPSIDWARQVHAATIAALQEIRPDIVIESQPITALDAATASTESAFLDTSHFYAETLAELEAWERLITPGGVFFGHDFWAVDAGVMDAVNEYFGTRQLPFEVVPQTRLWLYRKA